MSGPMPTPEGYEWISSFAMSKSSDWLAKNRDIKIDDVVSVDVHPSGRWAVVDMGDTVSWVRIPDDVHCIDFRRQEDLRELPKASSKEETGRV